MKTGISPNNKMYHLNYLKIMCRYTAISTLQLTFTMINIDLENHIE